MKFSQDIQSKKDALKQTIAQLKRTTDGLGFPVEESIAEPCALLNLLHIPTTSSCAGHTGKRITPPYIQGTSRNRPSRYYGEITFVKKLIKKHNLRNKSDIFDGGAIEDEYNTWRYDDKRRETKQYKRWYARTLLLTEKVRHIIDVFNTQNTNSSFELYLNPICAHYRIQVRFKQKPQVELGRAEVINVIKSYQKTFRAFTVFLRKEYFAKQAPK